MITRVVAAVLAAFGLVLPVAPVSGPATAGGPSVTVADMQFTPATLKVGLGATVTWNYPDSISHTSTSTQGFWNSGPKSGGASFQHTFASAGTYPYQCTIHTMMRGSVQVPVSRSGSTTSGWTLAWSNASGSTYDVQVRKGKGKWMALKNDTSAMSASFHRKGTWSVRARTQTGSETSSWSPAVSVRTS